MQNIRHQGIMQTNTQPTLDTENPDVRESLFPINPMKPSVWIVNAPSAADLPHFWIYDYIFLVWNAHDKITSINFGYFSIDLSNLKIHNHIDFKSDSRLVNLIVYTVVNTNDGTHDNEI